MVLASLCGESGKMESERIQFTEETVDLVRKQDTGCWLPKKRRSALDCLGIGIDVLEDLGQGKFSKVKKVHCRKLNKDFAAKIISKQHAPRDYLEVFLPREITILKKIDHERLVGMEGALLTNKHAFLLLDYMPNGDLQQFISTHGHLSEEESRRIFYQLLDAVSFIHSLDVVHRDIKCDNIYFDGDYNIKLGDFGFACVCSDCELLTEACGSYVYAAPEIMEGEPYLGKVADLWSMGVVLYAMLCGRLPFHDETFDILLDSIYNPREKLRFHTKVSKDCRHFVRAMLNHNAMERISMHELKGMDWLNKPIDVTTADFTSPTHSRHSYAALVDQSQNRRKSIAIDMGAEHGFAENQKADQEPSAVATVSDVLKALAVRHAFEDTEKKTRKGIDPGIGRGPHKFTPDATGLKGPAARRISIQLSSCQLFPQSAKGDHHGRHVTFETPLAGHADLAPSRKASLLMLSTGHTKTALRRGSLAVHRGALMASGSMIHMANEDLMNSATRLNEMKIGSEISHLHYFSGSKAAHLASSKKKKGKESVRRNSVITETLQILKQPGALTPQEQAIVNMFRSKCEQIKHLVAD